MNNKALSCIVVLSVQLIFTQAICFAELLNSKTDISTDQRLANFSVKTLLAGASQPPKLFFAPTSGLLRSFEVCLSGGSSYSAGENGGFLARAAFGLGGIAEVEFSTSEVINELTGEMTRFPTRSLKIGLIPEKFQSHWYVPQLAAQLRTSSWGKVVQQGDYLLEANTREVASKALTDIHLESRITTLYLVAGKDGELGGIHLGFSITDVRTREGWLRLFDSATLMHDQFLIPEISRNIVGPFGGIILNMNQRTQILMEVEPIPEYTYDVERRIIYVKRAWMGITGIRFFIGPWFTWDTGIQYQSNFNGIADAQINTTVNIILPLRRPE